MEEDENEQDDDYDREVEETAALRKLCGTLSAAGFNHRSGPFDSRRIVLSGQYREWLLQARLDAEWFNVYSTVGKLPAEPGLRSELLLWLARANNSSALLKYSVTKNDTIVLEFYMRSPLLSFDDVRNAIWFLHAAAEREYLMVLRIASGEARLTALSGAFSLDAKAPDGRVTE